MGAKNEVIEGDYRGCLLIDGATVKIRDMRTGGFWGTEVATISKLTVEDYEIIDEEKQKSVGSAATRGLVGAAFLGPLGLAAGVLSAKKKGIYLVAIQFNDGKKSLIEVDDKILKSIKKSLF